MAAGVGGHDSGGRLAACPACLVLIGGERPSTQRERRFRGALRRDEGQKRVGVVAVTVG